MQSRVGQRGQILPLIAVLLNTSGVLLYRNPAQRSALDFSSYWCNFSGWLYFPTTQVNYSNAGGNYTVPIFGNADFSTSSTLDFGTPPAGRRS